MDHRISVRKEVTASCIIKIRGERELLLEDIVLSVYEREEERPAERDGRTDLERRLRVAGDTIGSNAFKRAFHGSAGDEREGSGEDTVRKQQHKRTAAAVDSVLPGVFGLLSFSINQMRSRY